MSISIFFFAVAIVAATVFMKNIIDEYGNVVFILPVVSIGIILALTTLFLSFNFVCVAHLTAWLKYDHVVGVSYKIGHRPSIPLDLKKIIYHNDFNDCSTVVMAWDDNQTYDDIIKGKQ